MISNPSPSHGIRSSFAFAPHIHAGNEVRGIAVRHGLLQDTYPLACSLPHVLWDVQGALKGEPGQRGEFLSQLQGLSEDTRLNPTERESITRFLSTEGAKEVSSLHGGTSRVLMDLFHPLQSSLDAAIRTGETLVMEIEHRLADRVGQWEQPSERLPANFQGCTEWAIGREVGAWRRAPMRERVASVESLLNHICRARGVGLWYKAVQVGEIAQLASELEPDTAAEMAWRLCLEALTGIAETYPNDDSVQTVLRTAAGSFPLLRQTQSLSLALYAFQVCGWRMFVSGYPEVSRELHFKAASQIVASFNPHKECDAMMLSGHLHETSKALLASARVDMRVLMEMELLRPLVYQVTDRSARSKLQEQMKWLESTVHGLQRQSGSNHGDFLDGKRRG